MFNIYNSKKEGYYLTIGNNYSFDEEISNLLDIGLDKYIELGLQCNGFVSDVDKELYFKKKEDIKKFINKLSPYVIMYKLNDK